MMRLVRIDDKRNGGKRGRVLRALGRGKVTAVVRGRFTKKVRSRLKAAKPTKRKKGTTLEVPPRLSLAAAFSSTIAAQDVGRALGLHECSVARARACAAGATMEYQLQVVQDALRGTALLDFAFDICAFDGARLKLAVKFDPCMSVDQQTSAWECMAVRRILCVGTADDVHGV